MNNNNNKNNNLITNISSTDIGLVSPVKSYENAELLKDEILKDNRDQSGVYRWVNNLNGKTYVGSGVNLAKRLGSYYNKNVLNRNPRPIQNALLKYGHMNFTLEILEYCPKTKLLEREQFYLDSKTIKMDTDSDNRLDPNFVTGFVDGEGCFIVSITKNSECKSG